MLEKKFLESKADVEVDQYVSNFVMHVQEADLLNFAGTYKALKHGGHGLSEQQLNEI